MNQMGFDTRSQANAVCPYCGYEDPDSWELGYGLMEDSGATDCPSCEKEYKWLVWTEHHYTTEKIEENNG